MRESTCGRLVCGRACYRLAGRYPSAAAAITTATPHSSFPADPPPASTPCPRHQRYPGCPAQRAWVYCIRAQWSTLTLNAGARWLAIRLPGRTRSRFTSAPAGLQAGDVLRMVTATGAGVLLRHPRPVLPSWITRCRHPVLPGWKSCAHSCQAFPCCRHYYPTRFISVKLPGSPRASVRKAGSAACLVSANPCGSAPVVWMPGQPPACF